MQNNPTTILGINPGARYLGFAVFQGYELKDWGIKVMKGKWSDEKTDKVKRTVLNLIEQHRPDALAIKKLHPSRSSPDLDRMVTGLKTLAETNGLTVREYSIKYLDMLLSPDKKINKERLAELMSEHYPVLFPDLEKEKSNRNRYYVRMFEAVALGYVCFKQLDKY